MSDTKYQVEERKRRISAAMDGREKNSALALVKENYYLEKEECQYWINQSGNPSLKAKFEKLVQKETEFLNAGSSFVLKNKMEDFRQLSWEVRKKDPGILLGAFHYYASQPPGDFKDSRQAKKYIETGEKAIERKNYDELYVMLMQLYLQHPDSDRKQSPFSGTGIG